MIMYSYQPHHTFSPTNKRPYIYQYTFISATNGPFLHFHPTPKTICSYAHTHTFPPNYLQPTTPTNIRYTFSPATTQQTLYICFHPAATLYIYLKKLKNTNRNVEREREREREREDETSDCDRCGRGCDVGLAVVSAS
jgi:hypothetical protein